MLCFVILKSAHTNLIFVIVINLLSRASSCIKVKREATDMGRQVEACRDPLKNAEYVNTEYGL